MLLIRSVLLIVGWHVVGIGLGHDEHSRLLCQDRQVLDRVETSELQDKVYLRQEDAEEE